MSFIYIPGVLVVLYYALYYYFTRNFNYWKKRNVVGPKPIPIFGNLKESALRKKYFGNVIKSIYDAYPKEKVVGIYRMTTPALLVRDLDIIKHIMMKDFELFKDRGISFSTDGLGMNLFHADPEAWGVLRSRFSPMFIPGKLKSMFHLINERSNIFIKRLEEQCQINRECEIYTTMQKYTISTIFACAFGVDIDPFVSKMSSTLQDVDRMTLTPSFGFELDMMYPGILKQLNISIFPAKATNFFEKLVSDVWAQRNGEPSARGDFMDLIINMRKMGQVASSFSCKDGNKKSVEITDEVITGQAFVFYTGGYETSATTTSYLLYQLALNQNVQDKAREEVIRVMKAHNGEITYESLNEMKYLEQAFSETLRMYPIVEPLQRMAQTNYKIPDTDVVIEKGKVVYVSVLGIHHDEKHYPKPEIFDPDRFDPEVVRNRHPCAYLPFGIGPRNCIGMRFGAIQGRLGVARILSKFRVEICKNTEIPLSIKPNKVILGPKNGIFLNVTPLERN